MPCRWNCWNQRGIGRIDAVDPTATLKLDRMRLMSFPEGYRHLAYLQIAIGYSVRSDMPGVTGPEVEKLYAKGAQWLKGASIEAIDGTTQRLAAWPVSLLPVLSGHMVRAGATHAADT